MPLPVVKMSYITPVLLKLQAKMCEKEDGFFTHIAVMFSVCDKNQVISHPGSGVIHTFRCCLLLGLHEQPALCHQHTSGG